MTERDRPAIGVDVRGIIGQSQFPQHRERLRGEGLIELDCVHLADIERRQRKNAPGRGHGPHAHDARGDPGGGGCDDARARLQSKALHRLLGCDDERAGAIVDAGCVARGHRAISAKRCRQLLQLLETRIGARMLILAHDTRLTLFLRDLDRHELRLEKAARPCRGGALLAAQCEAVLVLAAHLEFRGDVLAGLGHRVDPIHLFHARINKAPADRGIEYLRLAAKRGVGLRHDERRARHGLNPACDHKVGLARLDRARRDGERIES